MKLVQIFVFVLLGLAGIGAAAAQVPAWQCNGCAPAQEVQLALSRPGTGLRFVYNIPAKRIRKFQVWQYIGGTQSLPATPPGPTAIDDEPPTVVASVTIDDMSAGRGGTRPLVREVLEHAAVDPGVQAIFNAMVAAERGDPGVLARSTHRIDIGAFGQTVGIVGPTNFDPRQVAWTRPSGEFLTFMERVRDRLEDATSAKRIDPELGALIHDVLLVAKSVNISLSAGTGGANVTSGLSLDFATREVRLKVCDAEDNCVNLVVRQEGATLRLVFENVTDRANNLLPSYDEARNLNRRFDGVTSREPSSYARWLQNRQRIGVVYEDGNGTCRGYILACTAITDTNQLACRLHCQ